MSKSKDFDHIFKCIIIGDSGTGKSCCLHQFVEGKFRSGQPKHTIGVEFGSKILQIGDGMSIKLQIWDTAGQERFRAITRSYYREAAAALVVYDITDKNSFLHVQNWINDAKSLAGQNICIMIVGNKCDLKEKRQVPLLEASRFAQENSALFLETSALTGENVTEAFYKCARSVLAKVQSGDLFVRDPDDQNTNNVIQIGNYIIVDENGLCAC